MEQGFVQTLEDGIVKTRKERELFLYDRTLLLYRNSTVNNEVGKVSLFDSLMLVKSLVSIIYTGIVMEKKRVDRNPDQNKSQRYLLDRKCLGNKQCYFSSSKELIKFISPKKKSKCIRDLPKNKNKKAQTIDNEFRNPLPLPFLSLPSLRQRLSRKTNTHTTL